MDYEIRPIETRDVQDVLWIENQCFKEPWDLDNFNYIIEHQGIVRKQFGSIQMMVVEYESRIPLHISLGGTTIPENVGHLLNIAVIEEHRRNGIARNLVRLMFSSLEKAGASSCFLEVRESNEIAQIFYKEIGMTPLSRRRKYYGDEDAIIFHIVF